MNKHEGDVKQFTHLSRSWYGAANLAHASYVDEVTFGFYSPEGGTSGEMSMRWIPLGNAKRPTARLECFEDSFSALAHFKDVIDRLGEVDGDEIQPAEFCALLRECGFKDATKEAEPGQVDRADLLRIVRGVEWERMNDTTLRRVASALR